MVFSDLSYELPVNRPVQGSRVGTLNTNFLHTVCMANPEQVDLLIIRMTAAKHQLSPHSLYEPVDFLVIRMRAAKHQLSPHGLYGQP